MRGGEAQAVAQAGGRSVAAISAPILFASKNHQMAMPAREARKTIETIAPFLWSKMIVPEDKTRTDRQFG